MGNIVLMSAVAQKIHDIRRHCNSVVTLYQSVPWNSSKIVLGASWLSGNIVSICTVAQW